MKGQERALAFDQFGGELKIRLELRLETGLHIGAGKDPLDPATPDSPVVRDISGRPYVPGSSIKGAWRAHLERVVRTVGGTTPGAGEGKSSWLEQTWSCDPLAEPCIGSSKIQELRKKARDTGKERARSSAQKQGTEFRTEEAWTDQILTETIVSESCDVCLLFGSSWMASRVSVRDAKLSQPWREAVAQSPGGFPYEQRHGVGIDRDSGAAKVGILYQTEVVPPEVTFETEVVARDLAPRQRQLLCVALLELLNGRVELGGKTSRGLGKVAVKALSWEETTRERLRERLLGNPPEVIEEETLIMERLRQGMTGQGQV